MTAELIELWNTSFFQQRGVEVVLFKGRERRSGPFAGTIETRLQAFDVNSDLSSSQSSSLSDDSDSSVDDKYSRAGQVPPGPFGPYGRPDAYATDGRDAKRRQREEKKRRHKEKKAKKKAHRREKAYAVYLTCVAPRESGMGGHM